MLRSGDWALHAGGSHWLGWNDKLKQAQKHLNDAGKYLKDVLGKTKRELETEIADLQKTVDGMREPASKPSKPPQLE